MNARRKSALLAVAAIAGVALTAWALGALRGADVREAGDRAEPETGRWRELSAPLPNEDLDDEQRRMIQQLEAIGYLSGSRETKARGIAVHERSRVHPGPNFFSSGHAPEAILMDMDGDVLHRWRADFAAIWPERTPAKRANAEYWRRAVLLENGDVLAIFEGLGLVRLDRDSNVLWANALGAHHDLQVLANGDIYVLERRAHVVPRIHPRDPILEDFLTVIDRHGTLKRSISLLEAFENSNFRHVLGARLRKAGDIFHTNSVEILDDSLVEQHPAFRAGRLLTAMNAIPAFAVVDLESEEVVWARRVAYRGLHDPGALASGRLLLFENRGSVGASRVVELEPHDLAIRWRYVGSPERPFFSRTCGTAQRLPNGNTLVTESDNGRAFEVAPEGDIVWEFFNPHRAGEGGRYIATLFELVRLPADFRLDWLPDASQWGYPRSSPSGD